MIFTYGAMVCVLTLPFEAKFYECSNAGHIDNYSVVETLRDGTPSKYWVRFLNCKVDNRDKLLVLVPVEHLTLVPTNDYRDCK